MLRLTIASTQSRRLGNAATHLFMETGGTIGRSARCDWMLPDEKNRLSAQHARIVHDGRGYIIIDTSTNGVYLNGRDHLLGRNQSAQIHDGDRLYLADYVIDVAITDWKKAAAQTPDKHTERGNAESPIPADLDLGDAPAPAPRGHGEASAFWEALGLPPSSLPDDVRERLMRGLGGAMREALSLLSATPHAAAANGRRPHHSLIMVPDLSRSTVGEIDHSMRTLVAQRHVPAAGREPAA